MPAASTLERLVDTQVLPHSHSALQIVFGVQQADSDSDGHWARLPTAMSGVLCRRAIEPAPRCFRVPARALCSSYLSGIVVSTASPQRWSTRGKGRTGNR